MMLLFDLISSEFYDRKYRRFNMSAKNNMVVLLLLVYAKIFIVAISSPKTQEILTRDPLCPNELNVNLPLANLVQPPEHKHKTFFFYCPDIHSSYLEDLHTDCSGLNISDSSNALLKSYHKSYLRLRQLRI